MNVVAVQIDPADPRARPSDSPSGGGRWPTLARQGAGPGASSNADIGRMGLRAALRRHGAWLPVVAKAVAITASMLGLAAIGAVSILHGSGVDLAALDAASTAAADDLGGTWLKPSPAATAASSAARASVSGAAGAIAHPHERAREPSRGVTPDGKVVLNAATAEELTRLPGVGRRRADAIVKLRTRLKRFRRVSDLLRVRGIGVRSLRRMKPHLVLDPPADRAADGGAG